MYYKGIIIYYKHIINIDYIDKHIINIDYISSLSSLTILYLSLGYLPSMWSFINHAFLPGYCTSLRVDPVSDVIALSLALLGSSVGGLDIGLNAVCQVQSSSPCSSLDFTVLLFHKAVVYNRIAGPQEVVEEGASLDDDSAVPNTLMHLP